MNITTAFKEYKKFNKNKPWDVNTMTFPSDIFSPPHYAETIEVLLCYNIKGDIHIGGKLFNLSEHRIFFIAPNIVHSMHHKKSDGLLTILKINPAQLEPFLDLNAILSFYNTDYLKLPIFMSDYEAVSEIANILDKTRDISEGITAILHLFKLFQEYADSGKKIPKLLHSQNDILRQVIEWTERNFTRRVSLEEISENVGYDKHYFCRKFKQLTGITYLTYLNNLRIRHACKLLKSGTSIVQTAEKCGFDDCSYFITVFKKIMGITPKKYQAN